MTITFPLWQIIVSVVCIMVGGVLAGIVFGMKWERHRRQFAVKTVVKADGTRETHLMTTATEDEAAILEYMECAADALEDAWRQLDQEDDHGNGNGSEN